MLVVVSPAKKLNMEPVEGVTVTEPAFARHAEELAGVARALSVAELQKLLYRKFKCLHQTEEIRFTQR